jgi:hypothetical protein
MATILEFIKPGATPREAQPSTQASAEAGAEIIIFPGVRYERWDDTETGIASRVAIEVIEDGSDGAAPPRRAAVSSRSAAATRKKPRTERKRDILEIPD